MADTCKTERTIAAVFEKRHQLEGAVRVLVNDGHISEDSFSVLDRSAQARTEVLGFMARRDFILGSLGSGALLGSLFGLIFSALTGIGILLVPFVGPVVAAGPLEAALLGTASGAAIGTAGVGLASVLTTFGLPQQKVEALRAHLDAGKSLLVIALPADKTGISQARWGRGIGVWRSRPARCLLDPQSIAASPSKCLPGLRKRDGSGVI